MEKTIFAVKLVNTNTIVLKSPCVVGNISLSGDGANADCDIYDGENAQAERKYHLETLSGTTSPVGAGSRKKFNYGIYIVVNAATTFVMIEYVPLPGNTKVQAQL